jgi:DNA-binding response OmpR family regulator
MSRGRVLVVEDDPQTRELLQRILERAGYAVLTAPDGRAGLRELYAARPDLVILDVKMPELDGWATLERIRDLSEVPVLMLSAHEGEMERVRGLQAGADDYVVKPFGHQELLARVQSCLRRGSGREEDHPAYADGTLDVDFAQRLVRYRGREIRLTPLEFRLLGALVRNANIVLSREQLLQLAWGDPLADSTDQVKLYVSYLRRKLEPDAPLSTPVQTVRGFGYRYRPPQNG